MNNIIITFLILSIASWFIYSLYKMWRGAVGADCADCSLGGGFDYRRFGRNRPSVTRPKELVTGAGHHIIIDEAAARQRRERIRKMMQKHS